MKSQALALAAFVGLLASMASAQQAADAECACLTASQLSSVEGWSDAKFVDSDGMKKVTLSGITYTYPALYGLENCAAHDATQKPYCDAADPPEWCADRWCYVDHTNCKYPAVKSSYFAGVDLRYSYTTCGSKNTFYAWFDENAAASGAHAITDIVDVLTGYLTSIIIPSRRTRRRLRPAAGAATPTWGATARRARTTPSGRPEPMGPRKNPSRRSTSTRRRSTCPTARRAPTRGSWASTRPRPIWTSASPASPPIRSRASRRRRRTSAASATSTTARSRSARTWGGPACSGASTSTTRAFVRGTRRRRVGRRTSSSSSTRAARCRAATGSRWRKTRRRR